MWRCPICHKHLADNPNSSSKYRALQCDNNHTFDQAKQGYFNLLPVQNKRSKLPGDDKSMVQARHEFLSLGYYDHLIHTIYGYLQAYQNSLNTLYDAGCGTGYYLNQLGSLLNGTQLSGHDISKEAIICASKKYKHISFCVASTVNVPIMDETQDLIVQVFSPPCENEYRRLLKQNGILVIVEPATSHLKELKAMLYETVQAHQTKQNNIEGFDLLSMLNASQTIEFSTPNCALNLLKMTPYYWSADEAQKAYINNHLRKVTTDFSINIYKKR
ncbi:putative RNA methyltransferase [Glaciecola sp. KUL10]|uniref:putative RNA methyltransferase n=1 Tax=Glaciecola sp. (strain KUL10) TaxID=2161813 RepID=UPI000D78AEA1|nr:methyltransferase domain-containing protein [Glaciecola sp. KUL10]GBL02742.1 rRNA (guanine-N1-)-methyltransferase [Glaciecola sp. KUL10]